jgi:hypothetical protein
MAKRYQVVEALKDGDLLFEATLEELMVAFDSNRDKIMRTIRRGQMIEREFNIIDPDKPVKLNKIEQYCVYDTHDSDLLVLVGTQKDVLEFLGIGTPTFFSAFMRGSCVGHRYRIEKL